MIYIFKKVYLTCLVLCVFLTAAFGQTPQSPIKTIIGNINNYNANLPGEKLYLSFDKPYYAIGDTIWFKGYMLNPKLIGSLLSSRVYIDVVNDSSVVVKRYTFASQAGLTWGNIALSSNTYREGGYTLRAYTNWMRNFGEESFFYKSFFLAGQQSDKLLINVDAKLSADDKNTAETKLKFIGVEKQPVDSKNLDVKLYNGKKVVWHKDMQTGNDGELDNDFNLQTITQLKNLTLIAADKQDSKKIAIISINVNRAQDIDLQFMPEGGQLVSMLPTNIAFKAIGEDGRGIDVKGTIIDHDKKQVAIFSSVHKGMGTVKLTPQFGEVYTAVITLANGDTKSFTLPAVKDGGTLLQVNNSFSRDSIEVSILASDDLVGSGNVFHLIAEARNVVCYAASLSPANSITKLHIAKSAFPSGIVHFTLLNNISQPVNERLTFVDHQDAMKIDMKPGGVYESRDSVAIAVKVTNSNGKPLVGSFSVAVTDDKQVKSNADNASILTAMLLTSDLKGYVEEPAYYFHQNQQSWVALDALLLTQGWVGYDWKAKLSQPVKPQFSAEPEFAVKGRITNLFNRPMSNTNIYLYATGKHGMYKDTVSNNDGRFIFNKLPLVMDSTKFMLSGRTKGGRTISGAAFSFDDPEPAKVVKLYNTPVTPWYVNADSTLLNYVKTNKSYHDQMDRLELRGGKLLSAVNIRDKAMVKNSQNLNGNGNSDQTITTAEMEAAGKATLLDVIQKKVKDFGVHYLGKQNSLDLPKHAYFIRTKAVHFIIDGIDIDRFYEGSESVTGQVIPDEHYNYQQDILEYITAEEVIGLEVLYSSQYIENYNNENLNLNAAGLLARRTSGPAGSDPCYIEVTTRSGHGPQTKRANGVYVYKPNTVTLPKEFYAPRYKVKNTDIGYHDLRSTIYWNQHVFTNSNGEATLSFYAADTPTTYTLIFEGADLNGNIGYQTSKITVKAKK